MRCTKKDFGRYHVSEPPVEHLRDPLYKTEREIMKVRRLRILSALFGVFLPSCYASPATSQDMDVVNVLCKLLAMLV